MGHLPQFLIEARFSVERSGFVRLAVLIVYAWIDVDANYNLYVDADLDDEEDVEEVEVDGYADEDGGNIGYGSNDGYDYAEVAGQFGTVAPGHEYGMFSDGYAYVCDDDDEDGDCGFDEVSAYTSVNVPFPPPQITSLSIYSVNQGDQGQLTVTGTNPVQNAGDQLTVNLSRNAGPFTPVGTPTATSATFTYDFTSYPVGSYTLTVKNNEAESDGTNFTVNSAPPNILPPPDPCGRNVRPKCQTKARDSRQFKLYRQWEETLFWITSKPCLVSQQITEDRQVYAQPQQRHSRPFIEGCVGERR